MSGKNKKDAPKCLWDFIGKAPDHELSAKELVRYIANQRELYRIIETEIKPGDGQLVCEKLAMMPIELQRMILERIKEKLPASMRYEYAEGVKEYIRYATRCIALQRKVAAARSKKATKINIDQIADYYAKLFAS